MYYSNSMYYLVPLTLEQYEAYKASNNSIIPAVTSSLGEEYRKADDKKEADLVDPMEGLIRGNMFKNEYRGYKDYKPGIRKPTNEKESLLDEVMVYTNAAHDIALKLDIYPRDVELLKKFEEYNKKGKEAIKRYEDRYGPLTKGDSGMKNGEFSWITVPSPWLR